jgi:hypothetical protein
MTHLHGLTKSSACLEKMSLHTSFCKAHKVGNDGYRTIHEVVEDRGLALARRKRS